MSDMPYIALTTKPLFIGMNEHERHSRKTNKPFSITSISSEHNKQQAAIDFDDHTNRASHDEWLSLLTQQVQHIAGTAYEPKLRFGLKRIILFGNMMNEINKMLSLRLCKAKTFLLLSPNQYLPMSLTAPRIALTLDPEDVWAIFAEIFLISSAKINGSRNKSSNEASKSKDATEARRNFFHCSQNFFIFFNVE